ncbi:MAG: hydroxyisourate hydrolase [Yersiniaceae bacterium]|uniref:5-hydroxyisourate hydrolase n=1 Tax=Chimaeribacter coloradensis TaxID=2060068 RepID=A0A2N5DXR1_9GAMM|nr:hydroxyisourate hydrolase [Chimaeribacter coloradensis]MDU6411595.1 hydroxyisourate hydrolase [Yersiniaceae bacterium]PLR32227.1 hydroxyisourate hydrolase [Chimaeribacter coloradensis]
MSTITTHILDTALGQPAAGVAVWLSQVTGGQEQVIARSETNSDGRVTGLTPEPLPGGHYRLCADIGGYFARSGRASLYLTAILDVQIDAAQAHYHLPLLIAPYAYSTYRGS